MPSGRAFYLDQVDQLGSHGARAGGSRPADPHPALQARPRQTRNDAPGRQRQGVPPFLDYPTAADMANQ
ncbi:hypothetical protein GCM10010464_40810 [Pseudonocardia yunnanensis]|uniref:Uncharacterized protein n=1 Tax=Pseudonocardia yunnanensis TaxID=58107 RepID=A0ABW4F3J7_9PSEU